MWQGPADYLSRGMWRSQKGVRVHMQGAWVLEQKVKDAESVQLATRATPNGIHALHIRD